jgi:hypothetical protein
MLFCLCDRKCKISLFNLLSKLQENINNEKTKKKKYKKQIKTNAKLSVNELNTKKICFHFLHNKYF